MQSLKFWLRWSWRDWRARWIQIGVIALIIAIGTGGYAGMMSIIQWREQSHTAAFTSLNMYDLRVRLATGAFVDQGGLLATLDTIPDPEAIAEAEERLLATVQVRVDLPGETVLASGPVVGFDVSDGGPHVNSVFIAAGRGLTEADAGQDTVVLSRNFAIAHDLPESGDIIISGDRTLRYVGQGLSPEYFSAFASSEFGGILTPATYAPLFMPLATAQAITGQTGQVNDLVLSLAPGADREAVAAAIDEAIGSALPAIGFEIMRTEDDPARQAIYDDIRQDEQLFIIFAILIFVGATGAAFSLTSRFIEAQRREIGIAMSLGVPRLRIAIRPLLVGAEIALLGVVFGVAVGIALGRPLQSFLLDLQPLPVWIFDFQVGIFARAAVIGFILPFLATAIPVYRAVRVPPMEAMRAGYRAARGGGLAPLATWLRLPGSIFAQIPVRSLLRAPRRSLLTMVGIAAAMTVLISLVGVLDAFNDAIDRSDEATIGDRPDRLVLSLNGFHAIASSEVNAIAAAPDVGEVVPGLRLGAELIRDVEVIGSSLEFIDFGNDLWRPQVREGSLSSDAPGIVIAQKAADDLDVEVGDTVIVRHPKREGAVSFVLVESEMPVLGVHTHPMRPLAYIDTRYADLANLAGATNIVHVAPAAGSTADQVKDEMFALEVVALAEPVADISQALRDFIVTFSEILQIFEGLALFLALLIAINVTSINLDERARDYATMFAYGIPVRTVLRMTMIESALIGIGGTLLGTLGGFLMVRWILALTSASTLEDVGLDVVVEPGTVALAVVLGVVAVALAPLLTVRSLRRMDIPATLRVME
jgi:putative ABC transport system permease protein